MTQFTCKGVKQINNRISLNRISRRFSSARNFQKYWSQNVGQDFIVLDFFHVWKIFVGGDHAGGKGVCGRLMSSAQETQSMREIRLLHGRLPCKGRGLTGMLKVHISGYNHIVCIMLIHLCKTYHHETHSYELWGSLLNSTDEGLYMYYAKFIKTFCH
jgi:hypothetical protein